MKKLLQITLCLFSLLIFSNVVLAQDSKKLPHYFPEGLEKTSDPAVQFESYLRYLNNTSACIGTNNVPSIFFNSLTETKEIAGKKVKFVFDPYKRTSDGRILFSSACGQSIISEADFRVVADDFESQAAWAASNDFKHYKDLVDQAIKASAKNKKVNKSEEDFRKLLSQPVAESPSITHRDLFYLPLGMKESDCVPNEVHLGYLESGILGEAWLNTHIVYISLQARIMDHLIGQPLVMMHEFVHSNAILQNQIIARGLDLELEASIPMMLMDEDKMAVMFHGYAKELREMIHVFFGFDFKQAKKDMILFDHGSNLRVDPDKFREYSQKLDLAKKELLKWFPKAFAEFYSNQLFWLAMHDKLGDTNAVFKVMMAFSYDETILGGHGPTMAFLKTHEPEIMQMFDEEFKKLDKPSDSNSSGDDGDLQKYKTLFAEAQRIFGLSQDDILRLAKKYEIKPEDLKDKSISQLMSLFKMILEKEAKEVK